MRRFFTSLVSVILGFTMASAQISYLDRPDLLDKVASCLKHTYNFSFDKARKLQIDLSTLTPEHPAPVFLEALIVYWENFPLTPRDDSSDHFIDLMNETVDLAEIYAEQEDTHLEGIFFDLFGRAFKAMYWADNGKSGKLIPDLSTMYRHTKEGSKLKDQFVEFYFSTGLYNYYIEAYPEAHPVYKPLVSFMQKGDKEAGLKQLRHAIDYSVYLKVEALLFMSLIQLKYENDLDAALLSAEKLYQEYPKNLYYQGHLVTILLHQHRFRKVREILNVIQPQEDRYSEMIRAMAKAYMAENEAGNDQLARKEYNRTIELADSFGPFVEQFKAIGYMGLSRIYEREGVPGEARKYARKASRHTVYYFILNE